MPTDAPVLAAADSYDVSTDGLTYRFHLRRAARWSNGDAVVAEDFAAAWRRLVDPHTGAQYADLLEGGARRHGHHRRAGAAARPWACAPRMPHTLVVELVKPDALLSRLAVAPRDLSDCIARLLAAHGRGFAKPGVMVSNGAFVLTRWDFGSHLVAIRNRYYWNDRGHATRRRRVLLLRGRRG